MNVHPSHHTRISDASTFDEICQFCGAHDEVPGGLGELVKPCPKAALDADDLTALRDAADVLHVTGRHRAGSALRAIAEKLRRQLARPRRKEDELMDRLIERHDAYAKGETGKEPGGG